MVLNLDFQETRQTISPLISNLPGEKIFSLPTSYNLSLDVPVNLDCNEKYVYQITNMHGEKFAAKIMKNYTHPNEEMDTRIRSEFNATTYCFETSLSPFIPKPVELLTSEGLAFGMIMQWKNGQMINKLKRCLPIDSIQQLQNGLQSIPEQKRLDVDTFSSLNICFGPSGLWLAEIEYDTSSIPHLEYQQKIIDSMSQLKKYYSN